MENLWWALNLLLVQLQKCPKMWGGAQPSRGTQILAILHWATRQAHHWILRMGLFLQVPPTQHVMRASLLHLCKWKAIFSFGPLPLDCPLAQPDVSPELAAWRSNRHKTIPTKLLDYVCNTIWHSLTSHSSPSNSSASLAFSGKSSYSLTHFISCDKFSELYKQFLATVIIISELNRFSEALNALKWCDAMKLEINVLEKNKTWDLVPLSSR